MDRIDLIDKSLHAYTESLEDTSGVLSYRKKNTSKWQALLQEIDQRGSKQKVESSYKPSSYQSYLERFKFVENRFLYMRFCLEYGGFYLCFLLLFFSFSRTFTSVKWFAKPSHLSPGRCSLYGWSLASYNTLVCQRFVCLYL